MVAWLLVSGHFVAHIVPFYELAAGISALICGTSAVLHLFTAIGGVSAFESQSMLLNGALLNNRKAIKTQGKMSCHTTQEVKTWRQL
jgi:hypothetical protein